jgi:hypothetical protein
MNTDVAAENALKYYFSLFLSSILLKHINTRRISCDPRGFLLTETPTSIIRDTYVYTWNRDIDNDWKCSCDYRGPASGRIYTQFPDNAYGALDGSH